jgi:drug/metabolite transporter (DMT)-like permease
MTDLALSILSSSLIFVIFKLFGRFGIQTMYAIIVNYMVACAVGILYYNGPMAMSDLIGTPWFAGTVALGLLFIIVFNLMAATSQKMGVSVASVATKMSLAIPVLLGVTLYNEILNPLKVAGIILALMAVYFTSVKQGWLVISRRELLLPLLVFLGSGIIDSSIKYMQATHVRPENFPLFSSAVFGSAAAIGIIYIALRSFSTPLKPNIKNLAGGVCLGIPNYFSIFFLLRALEHGTLNSASIFTINNVAIVMLTTLLGILLFREHISHVNWFGIGMAVMSILLVALS